MFLCPLKYCPFRAHQLKKFLTYRYKVKMDFEQLRRGLTFQETKVWCVGSHTHCGLKNKVPNGMLTPNPQIERCLSPHDPVAPQLVGGLAICRIYTTKKLLCLCSVIALCLQICPMKCEKLAFMYHICPTKRAARRLLP